MALVCKQTAVLVACIKILDNNNEILVDLEPFPHFILYHIPQLA